MKKYKPELGQIVYGQPWRQHECPDHVISALDAINNYMSVFKICDDSGFRDTPFSNSGLRFKNDVFEANAYSWNDEEKQLYNFKYKDIEVSWYKHLHRGTTINRDVSHEEAQKMLITCLKSLIKKE